MMHYLSRRFAGWQRTRNDMAALRRLDDRLLRDMGIVRRENDGRPAKPRCPHN